MFTKPAEDRFLLLFRCIIHGPKRHGSVGGCILKGLTGTWKKSRNISDFLIFGRVKGVFPVAKDLQKILIAKQGLNRLSGTVEVWPHLLSIYIYIYKIIYHIYYIYIHKIQFHQIFILHQHYYWHTLHIRLKSNLSMKTTFHWAYQQDHVGNSFQVWICSTTFSWRCSWSQLFKRGLRVQKRCCHFTPSPAGFPTEDLRYFWHVNSWPQGVWFT